MSKMGVQEPSLCYYRNHYEHKQILQGKTKRQVDH